MIIRLIPTLCVIVEGTTHAMHLTSPEAQRAIKSIEEELLSSTPDGSGMLSAGSVGSIPSNTNAHSPAVNMGMYMR